MADSSSMEVPQISIKFGGTTSGNPKKKPPPTASSSLGKRQRRGHAFGGGDSESGSDDEEGTNGGGRSAGRHQRITAFGDNGAELERDSRDQRGSKASKSGPLVIERQRNRDWRADARSRRQQQQKQQQQQQHNPTRRQQGALPDGAGADQADREPADQDKPIQWGLTLTKKDKAEAVEEAEEESDTAQKEGTGCRRKGGGSNGSSGGSDTDKDKAANGDADVDRDGGVEKQAMDALLGKPGADNKRLLVIPQADKKEVTEEEVFSRDFRDAPDVSTLADYEAVPVEEFGAALLRGMGWDGKDRGPKVKAVTRRPNQLGLGAKALKGAEDLGAWNQGGSHKKARPPKLHEYRREEEKRREKRDSRYGDSYRAERERERDRDDRRHRHEHSSGGGGRSSSSRYDQDDRRDRRDRRDHYDRRDR